MSVTWISMGRPAAAQDMANAIGYIVEASDESMVGDWRELGDVDDHDAMPALVARDGEVGRDLTSYDCWDSPVGQKVVSRTNRNIKWALKHCHLLKFKRNSVPGYKTMGKIRYRPREVDAWVQAAARETDVPATLIHGLIKYLSGYRPHVVSDDGHIGIMQLHPDLLRGEGIEPGDLLNPVNNIRKGAMYMRSLVYRFRGLRLAIAAYQKGPEHVIRHEGMPRDRKTIWFTSEVYGWHRARTLKFPNDIAAESITYVFNILD